MADATFGFNPLQSLQQGISVGEQLAQQQANSQLRSLSSSIVEQVKTPGFDPTTSSEFRQLAALGGPEASRIAQAFGALDAKRKRSFFEDAKRGLDLLNAGRIDDAIALVNKRREKIVKAGGDTSDTDLIGAQLAQGQTGAAIQTLQQAVAAGVDLGFIKDPEAVKAKKEARLTPSERNFNRFQDLLATAQRTGDPADKEKAEQFGRQSRFIRASEQESADIKVDAAERKEVAKANIKRTQGFVDSGVAAADSTTNIRRSLNLLDSVKTGGFAAFKLRVSQAFGVEGANEAELTANLGRNVLAQLKPLFGAAFTAAEGQRLERISAKFGTSTAGNKRLLEQSLKIAERAARRGIAAADKLGDAFTAGEIRNALSFKLEDKAIGVPLGQPGAPSGTVQPGAVLRFDAQGNLIP